MVSLSIKAGVLRDELLKVMPEEVRATVKLYLDGKIDQWYSRTDGKGVVFFITRKDADEAKALMDELPLAKNGLVDFTYTPLSPLTPLRSLLQPPTATPRNVTLSAQRSTKLRLPWSSTPSSVSHFGVFC